MDKKQIIKKIIEKKEYSELTKTDLETVFDIVDKEHLLDIEKIKLARKLLMENYSGFGSRKILKKNVGEKNAEWFLKKHLSTRERFSYYGEIYERILKGIKENGLSIIDLGCGINGFSYGFFLELGFVPNYTGVEAVGQFVEKMNNYFKKKNYSGKTIHESLFNLESIGDVVSKTKKPRVIFLFKVLDSLESMERNYSKKLILSLKPKVKRFVVSFPTKSMVKRQKIWAERKWFLEFVEENFELLDDFELGDERYFVFEKK